MGLDLERIEALCFDVDGTLMDTDDQIVQQVAAWLGLFKGIMSDRAREKLARRIIMGLESPSNRALQFLDWIGLDGLYAALNNRLHRWGWRRLPTEYPLIPGTIAALEKLKPHYPMAIVSARGALQVDAFIAHHALEHFFVTVVSGQTRPRSKPHPDPILWAAEQMNLPPDACVMIGDTTVDIHAGRAAGTQTIAVLSGFGEAAELQKVGSDIILPSVAELPAILLA
jgi:phosphoglycolate phosphatase-like HAD superfamily hydrolase